MGPNDLLRFKKGSSPRVSTGDFPALLSTGCTDRIPPGRSPKEATQSAQGARWCKEEMKEAQREACSLVSECGVLQVCG